MAAEVRGRRHQSITARRMRGSRPPVRSFVRPWAHDQRTLTVRERGSASGEAQAVADARRTAQAARAAATGAEYSASDVGSVASLLSTLDHFEANDVMLERIRSAIADGRPLTGGQQNFMAHEALETRLMSEGTRYDDAHAEALKVHPPGRNDDPDVIDQFGKFGPWRRERIGLDPR